MIGREGENKVRVFGNAHEYGCEDGGDGLDTMEATLPAYVKSVRAEQKEKGEQQR